MDTSVGYHQAPRPPRVPLDEVLVKLYPEGYSEEFQADGINVGAGGISMRASVLPELGATMRCQFENPSGGKPLEMVGRVVWAHESGPYVGEFGIRFTELSESDQARIEAMIQRWSRRSTSSPTVTLRLGGVDASIVAEVARESGETLSVHHYLPFLAIGSDVYNATAGRLGRLDNVELAFDEDERTPKLVLSIGYAVEEQAAAPGPSGGSSTAPQAHARAELAEEGPQAPAGYADSAVEDEALLEAAGRDIEMDTLRDEEALAPAQRSRSLPDFKTHVHMALALLSQLSERTWETLKHKGLPWLRLHIQQSAQLLHRFSVALSGRMGERPRRKQVPRSDAARAHLKNTRRGGRRTLVLAALGCLVLAAGFGIYRQLRSEPSAAVEEGEAVVVDAETEQTVSETQPAEPKAKPKAAEAKPKAAEAKPAPAPASARKVEGTAFGAEEVKRAEIYTLRMSNPVSVIRGVVEDDGFSVKIPGALSLSRAGPIAAAHPDIERATILNRGDFSELTVRFVAGRKPQYRVEAKGASIEIQLER
jgi:hypothetical protein